MLPPQKIDGDYEAPKSEIWLILRLHVCKYPLHPVNAQIRASLAWLKLPPTYPQIRSPDQEGLAADVVHQPECGDQITFGCFYDRSTPIASSWLRGPSLVT